MVKSGVAGPITVAELDALRAELRSSAAPARRRAVQRLRQWQGRPVATDAAGAVLRAATLAYPWLREIPDDVGELLIKLLWTDPHQVGADDLEAAYLLCSERGRRTILETLARQADPAAVEVIANLLGIDGPRDILPPATTELFAALSGVRGVQRLAPVLAGVAWRRGWAVHVAGLLSEIADRGLLEASVLQEVCQTLAPLAMALVDTCDRAARGAPRQDLGRTERRRLDAVLKMFGRLEHELSSQVLRRALSSADPVVAARAVVVMAGHGDAVPEERVALLGDDPAARGVLIDGLGALGREFLLRPRDLEQTSLAEADLVAWLADDLELGFVPDEIEHRAAVMCPPVWGSGTVHLLAFRVRPPHWSAHRGFMMAVVGPYDPSAVFSSRRCEGFAAHSLYVPEDDMTPQEHVAQLAEAVAGSDPPWSL